MNNTQLKIFTMCYINEHDDLLKEEKIALMEWVKDASTDQVNYLLATGEVVDEMTQEHIDRLNEDLASLLPLGKQIRYFFETGRLSGDLKAIGIGILVAAAAGAGMLAYKKIFSASAKACAGREGNEKTSCIEQYKQKAQKAKMDMLKKGLAQCAKSKNPGKCKAKMMEKINKEKAKMGQL